MDKRPRTPVEDPALASTYGESEKKRTLHRRHGKRIDDNRLSACGKFLLAPPGGNFTVEGIGNAPIPARLSGESGFDIKNGARCRHLRLVERNRQRATCGRKQRLSDKRIILFYRSFLRFVKITQICRGKAWRRPRAVRQRTVGKEEHPAFTEFRFNDIRTIAALRMHDRIFRSLKRIYVFAAQERERDRFEIGALRDRCAA